MYPFKISHYQTLTGCIDAKLPNTTYGIEKKYLSGAIKPCSKTENCSKVLLFVYN